MKISINDNISAKIQVLRGLAIIAVVFIHTTPEGVAQIVCRPFLNFSVGMFLFLSGMLSDAKKWKPLKRITKILIPYIIWTFLYYLELSHRAHEWIIRDYFRYLLSGGVSAIMYYVFVYCEFTLLIPLINKLANSRFKYLGFIISPLEIICMRLIPMVYGIELNKYTNNIIRLSCLGWFTYFYLGYLLGNSYLSIKAKTRTIVKLWVISVLMEMLEGYVYYSLGSNDCGTQLKLTALLTSSLCCILAFKYIRAELSRVPSLLVTLGNYSFGIFFSHLLIKWFLVLVQGFTDYVLYPFNSILLLLLSLLVVMVGHKIFGRFAKYVAF